MSTSESVLNEMEVAVTNISDNIKKYRALLEEKKFTSTNIDYTAAIEKFLSEYDSEVLIMFDIDVHELATHLNSVVKAQQNYA